MRTNGCEGVQGIAFVADLPISKYPLVTVNLTSGLIGELDG